MENWNALVQLIADTQEDVNKAFTLGRGASAKRIRKVTLEIRTLITKIREDALNVYRKDETVAEVTEVAEVVAPVVKAKKKSLISK
jgi:hypothetical protein